MGAWAWLWPPLLLLGLLGRPPGATAQVCSVSNTFFEVEENTNLTEPLADIYVPEGQQVVLGPSSTAFAFRIQGSQLFLNVIPDYEENVLLQAHLECMRGGTLVTQLRVFVAVLDVNDNSPVFPFTTKEKAVEEDTKVNSTVIPETELEAKDPDKDDILFYTLQEVTPGASDFFSLVGANRPALRLDRPLDFYRLPNMTFQLLVRDTTEESAEPSHTATATLVLKVLPADLRPPWFLPCSFFDGYVCIQAQYHGAVPTGHKLPSPLVLSPGPIYAEDGDRAINQRVIYSIVDGDVDNIFAINPDSGNLTMAKSVPSPRTFLLVVKGEQADHARYSVTQVTVQALATTGSLPHFPQNLYLGTVALGSGAGVAVKDAAAPSQPLRIRAQDPEFPDLNSAIIYRVTNNSYFRMDGETVLTTIVLGFREVFYAEVEAKNTVTLGTATTVVEIRVSEQEAPPTGPPEAGGTAEPWRSTTVEAPRPPGPSQGPSTTGSGGSPGLCPPLGTTLRPPTSPTPGEPPSTANSTSPQPGTPGSSSQTMRPGTFLPTPPSMANSTSPQPGTPGGSSQTVRPGTFLPTPPSMANSTSPQPGTPGGSAQNTSPGTSWLTPPGPSRSPLTSAGTLGDDLTEDKRFSMVDMATLGGVLGALLLLALLCLVALAHKHYGHQLKCCSGKTLEPQPPGFENQAFHAAEEANWAPAPSPGHSPKPTEAPSMPAQPAPRKPPATPAPPSPMPPRSVLESPVATPPGESPGAVRSILTKERRPEGGYKAVWFGEDIGAEADVVVLNAPPSEADCAGDSGNEGSGDEDTEGGRSGSPHNEADADSTYI
ncbi:cadherin-related family member 5 isoform X1 [Otolemur garnettii]|uniref:cadherin-related family member 5 isoform X1 n=1 Tax=Otolemur garnettii TaxID=30611 RepID=UPI000C7F418B|nr:cadherin-related family member 5 isoform X1 [Otolemur garnettii]